MTTACCTFLFLSKFLCLSFICYLNSILFTLKLLNFKDYHLVNFIRGEWNWSHILWFINQINWPIIYAYSNNLELFNPISLRGGRLMLQFQPLNQMIEFHSDYGQSRWGDKYPPSYGLGCIWEGTAGRVNQNQKINRMIISQASFTYSVSRIF